jgi:hypothetical protein
MFITSPTFIPNPPRVTKKNTPKFGEAYSFTSKAGDVYRDNLDIKLSKLFRDKKPTWLYTEGEVQAALEAYVEPHEKAAHLNSVLFTRTSYDVFKRSLDGKSYVVGNINPGERTVYFNDIRKSIAFKDLV